MNAPLTPLTPLTPLVDAATLAAELAGDGAPVLLDVRWRLGGPPGADSYLAGHLPGALFADLDRDLAGPPGAGGRHPLPDAAVFQAAMRRAGVTAGRLSPMTTATRSRPPAPGGRSVTSAMTRYACSTADSAPGWPPGCR